MENVGGKVRDLEGRTDSNMYLLATPEEEIRESKGKCLPEGIMKRISED